MLVVNGSALNRLLVGQWPVAFTSLLNEIAFVHDVCSRKPGTEVYDPFSSNGMRNLKRLPILSR